MYDLAVTSPFRSFAPSVFLPSVLAAAMALAAGCGSATTPARDGGTTTPTCTGATSVCGEACVDTQTDFDNCGSCGKPCAAGQACVGGSCALACGGGTTKCGSACVDEAVDPHNCGACGKACSAGEACVGGSCTGTCASGFTVCMESGSGGTACVDPQSDAANCGGCGKACAAGMTCAMGACVASCQAGLTLCKPTARAPVDAGSSDGSTPGPMVPFCADLSEDEQNCGGCGKACGAGGQCVLGACTAACPSGSSVCGAGGPSDAAAPYCAVFATDKANCGSCGNACVAAGESCTAGACVCPGKQVACGSACTTTATDNNNCGACGTVCGPFASCITGVCTLTTTSAVMVSGTASCTTQRSNGGRKVAIDASNTIYAGMLCGTPATAAEIAVSIDGGNAYGAPTPLAVPNVSTLSVVGGGSGTAYVAVLDTAGGVWFTSTNTSGATWSTPAKLATTAGASWVGVAVAGTYVYVAAGGSGVPISVYASATLGAPFTTATVALDAAFGDVAVDSATGNVWALGDTGEGNAALSTSHGMLFATAIQYPKLVAELSDWTLGGGYIFEVATEGANVISLAASTTSSPVTGLFAGGQPQQQAISADAHGNAYVVQGLGTTMSLQQVFASTLTAGPNVALGNGTYPTVVAAPGSAVVAYTQGTAVYVVVQAF